MRSLEEIIAINAKESGVSVAENVRNAQSNQYLQKVDRQHVSVPPRPESDDSDGLQVTAACCSDDCSDYGTA